MFGVKEVEAAVDWTICLNLVVGIGIFLDFEISCFGSGCRFRFFVCDRDIGLFFDLGLLGVSLRDKVSQLACLNTERENVTYLSLGFLLLLLLCPAHLILGHLGFLWLRHLG